MLDDPSTPADELRASLDFMVGINRWLGGAAAVIDFLERSGAPREFSVVDLGSGSGDIAHAVVRWARRTGRHVRITAVDINPVCLEYAQRRFGLPEVRFIRHSAFDLAPLGEFDYAISSMFFHHLTDDRIVELLRAMALQARRGILVNDLYRSRPAFAGAWLLGAMTGRRIVRNDASLSVKRAFVQEDLERLAREAGLRDPKVRRRPVFRMTLEALR